MITLSDINKSYKIAKRDPGLRAAAKALFHKEYEIKHALKDVSFTVKDGEMVGYIGPNGAGKSSTIKIMSGILTPDSGFCEIDGMVPWKNRIDHVKNIGVVFGQRSQLWWDVPVGDSFELLKNIYKVDSNTYNKRISELSEMLNVGDLLKIPARQLSLGQRMRCELAGSLIHNPKILFLDEPTIGLDAVSKIAVRKFIESINREYKTTIILTTHDMQDIEAITKRILFIAKGEILLDGTMDMLKKRYSGGKKIIVYYSGDYSSEDITRRGIKIIENTGGRLTAMVDTEEMSVAGAIGELCRNLNVEDISVEGISAEEVVVSLYKEYKL